MRFEILGSIRNVEIIASGRGVDIRRRLHRDYGRGNWRKMNGYAVIRDNRNNVYEAEIHWYEAHGIGRQEFKIKLR